MAPSPTRWTPLARLSAAAAALTAFAALLLAAPSLATRVISNPSDTARGGIRRTLLQPKTVASTTTGSTSTAAAAQQQQQLTPQQVLLARARHAEFLVSKARVDAASAAQIAADEVRTAEEVLAQTAATKSVTTSSGYSAPIKSAVLISSAAAAAAISQPRYFAAEDKLLTQQEKAAEVELAANRASRVARAVIKVLSDPVAAKTADLNVLGDLVAEATTKATLAHESAHAMLEAAQ